MRFLRDAMITVLVLALTVVVVAVVVVRRGGLTADQEPGRLERTVASRLIRLSIPADAERQKNPFAGEANTWQGAVEHFQDHCASCHGRDGKGETEVGRNMYPPVPDLTSAEVQARSDGALFYIIQHGVRWTGMPAWRNEHSPEETWKLVSFLRKAPTLTEADLPREEPVATSGVMPGKGRSDAHEHP
jgi:mono/diheme cytochrome c family protein